MEFAEADRLLDRITDFLLSCGGSYRTIADQLAEGNFAGQNALQREILALLAADQYVLREENGEIRYFAGFYKVAEKDVPDIVARRLHPGLSRGTVLYVAEAGNGAGRSGMTQMAQEIRTKAGQFHGLFWHRPVKQDKVYRYPRQRGREV